MKTLMPYLHSAIVAGLIAVLLFTQTAFSQTAIAQEPSVQAAQQQTAPQQPPAPIERQNPERQNPDTAVAASASTPPLTPEALARQRLLSAHTLYLAKSTQDANFPASPDDAYNAVLANLKNWGHYQIVDSTAQADLVLQLRDAVHANVVDDTNDSGSTVYYLPSFQLTIADPPTLSPLWTVNVSVPTTVKQKNQPALVSAAAENLVSQLKLLVGDPLTAQDRAAAKQVTHFYHSRQGLAIGLAAAGIAAGLALFFIARHVSKDNAAAFCAAHGISPCPGA
jgi:hypothetical protein